MITWLRALGPALVTLIVVFGAGPLLSPDGVEMAAGGRCLWRLPLDPSGCAGLEPWFWPPTFSLLSGLLALALDPAVAALLAGLASFVALTLAAGVLGSRLGGPLAGALIPLVLAATPTLRSHALMGDARDLALALVFGAAALLSAPSVSRRALLGAGALLGLAILTREEAAAPAALLSLVALGRLRAPGALVPLVAACVSAPMVLFLSVRAGHLVPTPRSWQGPAARWVEAWPREWVFAELSAGTRGAPLRALLSQQDVASSRAPFDLGVAVPFLVDAARGALPPLLAALAVVGVVSAVANRKRSSVQAWTLAVLGAAALPYAAIGLLPEAQDAVVPANNILALVVATGILGGVGLAAGWTACPRRRGPGDRRGRGLLVLLPCGAGVWRPARRPRGPSTPPRVAHAADPVPGPVAASS